jgi:hypothetical protein
LYKNTARYAESIDNNDDDAEIDTDSITCTNKNHTERYRLADGNFIAKRQKPVIIRCVRYQQMLDQENYYREILMLFVPWRHEHSLIGDSESFTQQFKMNVLQTKWRSIIIHFLN